MRYQVGFEFELGGQYQQDGVDKTTLPQKIALVRSDGYYEPCTWAAKEMGASDEKASPEAP
jgi:hypothetical protein